MYTSVQHNAEVTLDRRSGSARAAERLLPLRGDY